MPAKQLRVLLVAVVAALVLIPVASRAQGGGDVNPILRQMDVAAKNFKNAQADFEWVQFQLVVQDKDVQKGSTAFRREGGETEMVARIQEMNGKPEPKELLYRNGTLQFYQPKIKQVTVFSAGANRSQYESFLTLGFGGSGAELEKNWAITYQGDEVIEGVKTSKLDLVPRQANVKQTFSHVTIWVDPARAISLKQQFFEPSGDYRLATYHNIRYNTQISADLFNLKTEPGTQVIHK
jgi:outer membrane lipoprotein-sorting protein